MTPAWLRAWIVVLALTAVSGSHQARRSLPHDAYVWQRQWTPAVAAAVEQSSDLVRAWRVLATRLDGRGRLAPVVVDWGALRRSGRPVVLVVRLDGHLAHWDEQTALVDIRATIGRWRRAGQVIAGVEIDHDCGTARLQAYARFLSDLRGSLDRTLPLAITALPAWLDSADADAVFAQADEIVLQVHAVADPRHWLFDRDRARRWLDLLARRTNKPFRVALPTYGARVTWRDDGTLLAVESEVPVLAGGVAASELLAPPGAVSALVRDLEEHGPAGLAGIVWFRLPTDEDGRAWSLGTWRAVIRGTFVETPLEVETHPAETPGMSELVLVNPGDLDAAVPKRIELPSSCAVADGVNGYALGLGGPGLSLERVNDATLRAHTRRIIGWARCAVEEVADAQP